MIHGKDEADKAMAGAFVSDAQGNFEPVNDPAAIISRDKFDSNNELILRAGKKRYCLVKAV